MRYTGRISAIIIVLVMLIFIPFYMTAVYAGGLEGITRNLIYNSIELMALLALLAIAWSIGLHYDKIRYLSEIDPLTEAYNRRYVKSWIDRRFGFNGAQLSVSSAGNSMYSLFLLLIDINNFKLINDQFGHSEGDNVLRAVSAILRSQGDGKQVVARWGGDEFLYICFMQDDEQLRQRISQIRQDINTWSKQQPYDLSVSTGTAQYTKDGISLEEVIAQADRRMYSQKT